MMTVIVSYRQILKIWRYDPGLEYKMLMGDRGMDGMAGTESRDGWPVPI